MNLKKLPNWCDTPAYVRHKILGELVDAMIYSGEALNKVEILIEEFRKEGLIKSTILPKNFKMNVNNFEVEFYGELVNEGVEIINDDETMILYQVNTPKWDMIKYSSEENEIITQWLKDATNYSNLCKLLTNFYLKN